MRESQQKKQSTILSRQTPSENALSGLEAERFPFHRGLQGAVQTAAADPPSLRGAAHSFIHAPVIQRKPDWEETAEKQNAPSTEGGGKEAEGSGADSGQQPVDPGPYWTHAWQRDRFDREALFIWQVGGKHRHNSSSPGYTYIRQMLALGEDDPDYDPRFEIFRHRPQVEEGGTVLQNWWFKKTPGWDDPEQPDDGSADFSDLAEFDFTEGNRKGTGFYYMGYVFDPNYGRKEDPDDPNAQYIGSRSKFTGHVLAPSGIILHDTPTPYDATYQSRRGKEEWIIPKGAQVTILAEGNAQNEGWVLVQDGQGRTGWIEKRFVGKSAAPKSKIHKTYIVQPGDTLEQLIDKLYTDFDYRTGHDRRTVALAIYLYNKGRPGTGVYRNESKYREYGSWKDWVDPWMEETRANYASVELWAGGTVYLPPTDFIEIMYKEGKLGKRPDWANTVIAVGRSIQGFIEGVIEGLWNAFIGVFEDLWDLIVGIVTGELFSQAVELFNKITSMSMSEIFDMIGSTLGLIWDDFKTKWNNPNPRKKWHFVGEIVGAIVFEIILAIATAGIGQVIAKAAKGAKLMKMFPKLAKLTDKLTSNPKVVSKLDDVKKIPDRKKVPDKRHGDVDVPDKRHGDVDTPDHYKDYESKLDKSEKDRLRKEADDAVDDNDSEAMEKTAVLAQAKIITEVSDEIDVPVSALLAELRPLAAVSKAVDRFEYQALGTPGEYSIWMIGSKYKVTGLYTVKNGKNVSVISSLRGKSLSWIKKQKPKNWRTEQKNNGLGWKWLDENGNERLIYQRPSGENAMKSKWSRMENGYFRWLDADGNHLDIDGNVVLPTDPDFQWKTHIPYEGVQ